jgi:hypothetical protein
MPSIAPWRLGISETYSEARSYGVSIESIANTSIVTPTNITGKINNRRMM